MRWSMCVIVMLAVSAIGVSGVVAQEPPGKAKVEIRWVEWKPVKGVTEVEGFQSSCDPKDIVYPHQKPALVLTPAEVAEVELKEHNLSSSGLARANYMVTIHLTKEARAKLAAACSGDEMRLVTIVVDGRYWGVLRYEKDKDKKFVPDAARAESFTPGVGFFSSRGQAQRLVNALK